MEKIFWLIEIERRWKSLEGYWIIKVYGRIEKRGWVESCWDGWNIMMC